MSTMQRFPKMSSILSTLIGQPYKDSFNCWDYTRLIFYKSYPHIPLTKSMFDSTDLMVEVWSIFDKKDYTNLIQPYDILLMCNNSPMVNHCGVLIDIEKFTHCLPQKGACIEYLNTYKDMLFQIVRLQELC